CICCEEPMSAKGNKLSRNPAICASCSSIIDGEGDEKERQLSNSSSDPAGAKHVNGRLRTLMPEIELSLFRIMQQAFHDTEKRARTAEILIRLTLRQNSLVIQMEDKGIGFDPKQLRRRCLTSFQEHVGLLGGICAIKSSPGKGTS